MESRITVRFPEQLLRQAKNLKAKKESLNDLVITALEQEVRRRQGWAAHQRIVARREAIRAKTGIQPNSTEVIRDLREGNRDA
jgi:hypothetical protein